MSLLLRRRAVLRTAGGELFAFGGAGDAVTTGLIYGLGSNRGASSFENPADGRGGLNTWWNKQQSPGVGLLFGTDRAAVSRYLSHGGLPNAGAADAALRWDLGPSRTFAPSHLAIRADNDDGEAYPQNFKLQGSSDASSWTDLFTHSAVDFPGVGQWQAWPVTASAAFRWLRLLQTGQSHSITDGTRNQLAFSEIEFWGRLWTQAPLAGDSHPWTGSFNQQDGMVFAPGVTLAVSGTAAGAASNLLDGNRGTYWVSSNATGQWVRFDAGAGRMMTVRQFTIRPRHDAMGQMPRAFKLQGSSDASSWTDLFTSATDEHRDTLGWGATTVSAAKTHLFEVPSPASYRYVRITNTAANYIGGQSYMGFSWVDLYGLLA